MYDSSRLNTNNKNKNVLNDIVLDTSKIQNKFKGVNNQNIGNQTRIFYFNLYYFKNF